MNTLLNKQFASYLTQLACKDTHVIENGYYRITFKIKKVMDPKCDRLYTKFRSNVDVIRVERRRRVSDGNTYKRDERNNYIWEYSDILKPNRSQINFLNSEIRRKANKHCGSFAPLFNIDSWRIETKSVNWPKNMVVA